MPSLDNRVNAFPLGNPNNLIHKLHHCCHVFSTAMTFVMYSMEAWKGSINNNCTLVFLNIKKKKYCHTFALLYLLKHLCCVSCLIATTQGRQAIAPHCGFTLYQKISYRANLLCLFGPKKKTICFSVAWLHNESSIIWLHLPISNYRMTDLLQRNVCLPKRSGEPQHGALWLLSFISFHATKLGMEHLFKKKKKKESVLSVIIVIFHLQPSCRQGNIFN